MPGELQGAPLWDLRYSADGFAFGDQPNDFLRSQEHLLRTALAEEAAVGSQAKTALCLAEGEGRNAVWLAVLGYDVTAVDLSAVGLKKAESLAHRHDVAIKTIAADLADFDLGDARWDLIISIWCHLPPPLRAKVHAGAVRSLRPGGLLVLTAYTPAQLERGTGGPRTPEMCMPLALLRKEFDGLEFVLGEEIVREVYEGAYHTGVSEVVQVVARRRRLP